MLNRAVSEHLDENGLDLSCETAEMYAHGFVDALALMGVPAEELSVIIDKYATPRTPVTERRIVHMKETTEVYSRR